MNLNLKKGDISISVNTMGAELKSVLYKDNEFMWNKKEFWAKTSPVLFPFVGALKNNKYEYENKVIEISSKHGFAREMEFSLSNQGDDFLEFKLSSNEDTLKVYPFEFDFFVKYTINDDSVTMSYNVKNKTDGDMYFSVGGHPAFLLPTDDNIKMEDYYIEFSEKETTPMYVASSEALILETPIKELKDENIIPITDKLFEKDAIIFKNLKSNKTSIKCKKSDRVLTVDHTGFPFVAFWKKEIAPYLCIEPWYGISDSENSDGILEHKEGILKISKNEEFNASLNFIFKI